MAIKWFGYGKSLQGIVAQLNKMLIIGNRYITREGTRRGIDNPPQAVGKQKPQSFWQSFVQGAAKALQTVPANAAIVRLLLHLVYSAKKRQVNFFKPPGKDVVNGAGDIFKGAGGCFKVALTAY